MTSRKFPVSIRSGSVTVLIYRLTRGDGREIFTVAAHVGGRRVTRQFGTFGKAQAEAKLKAEQLAAGRVEAASMSIAERDEYVAARKAAAGTPLLTIVQEWQRARSLAGADVLRACTAWSERHGKQQTTRIKVADAIKAYVAAKSAAGVNTKAGHARTLPRFAESFGDQPIGVISETAISAWLAQFSHPVTRNTHRKRIVALFRWCRDKKMLPRDIKTEAEYTDRSKEPNAEIGLVSPEQLRGAFRLIAEKASQYLPALAVAAFCGLRRAEVHGQQWQHIDLERRLLRVSKAKPQTPANRLVTIPECAVEWLLKQRKREGPICANLAIDRIRDICRTAGLDLADNGFRHTWISARVVISGNIAETSLEAGNSPKVINAHYRELMRKDEAEQWFAIQPEFQRSASAAL